MTETPAPPTPEVTLYTDGGAEPNPGFGGWAAILLDPASGAVRELSGGEPGTTNNRMELTAAIRGLEALVRRARVRLFTDSQYLRKGVTEWLPGWIARGWRRKDGALQNEDLWRRLADLTARHEIQWQWVKGHSGNRYNERADVLASAAIRAQRRAAGGVEERPATDAEVFLRVSCAKGRGGWAALVRQGEEERILTGAKAPSSANQLDLLAALAALEALPAGASVAIHTGSDYLRHGATRWLEGWKRRGWTTQEGQPVQNRELWQTLERALQLRKVEWPGVEERDTPELERLAQPARKAALGER
jgi:ribonuclease HI